MSTNLIDDIGGPTVVARMVGRRVPTVIEWRTRGVPFICAPAIELGTAGRHLVEAMCPDAPWLRIEDAAWPHPSGRPVLDFGALVAAKPAKEVGCAS